MDKRMTLMLVLLFLFVFTIGAVVVPLYDPTAIHTEEEVEDFVGTMLGGTETLIAVTYVDATNDIDFVVDNDLHNYSWTNVDGTDLKTDSITQAWDDDLDDIAELIPTNSYFMVGDGTDWVTETGATARTSLGLGTMSTENAASLGVSLVPDTDDAYDLGATNTEWKDLYIDGTAYIDTTYTSSISATGTLLIQVNAGNLIDCDAEQIESGTHYPTTDDAYDLGTSSNEWNDLYIDGDAYIDCLYVEATSESIIKRTDNTFPSLSVLRDTPTRGSPSAAFAVDTFLTNPSLPMTATFGTGMGFRIGDKDNALTTIATIYAYRDATDNSGKIVFRPYLNGSAVSNTFSIVNEQFIGVGTESPVYTLDVMDNIAAPVARFMNDGDATSRQGIIIKCGEDAPSGNTELITFYDGDGDKEGYIENAAGTIQLTDISDERIKENIISTSKDSLQSLKSIPVREYNFKDSPITHTGFVAQEIMSEFPEAVSTARNIRKFKEGEEIPQGVRDLQIAEWTESYTETIYLPSPNEPNGIAIEVEKQMTVIETEQYMLTRSRLIPHLVKAVQQLEERVGNLEAKLALLEKSR